MDPNEVVSNTQVQLGEDAGFMLLLKGGRKRVVVFDCLGVQHTVISAGSQTPNRYEFLFESLLNIFLHGLLFHDGQWVYFMLYTSSSRSVEQSNSQWKYGG